MRAGPAILRLCLAALGLAALAGCAATDTYRRPGTWHPDGANAANIAAMAADPADLLHGRGSAGSDGPLAARPVERLWDGAAAPAGTGAVTVGPAGAPAGGGAGGAPSGFATPLPASGASGSGGS